MLAQPYGNNVEPCKSLSTRSLSAKTPSIYRNQERFCFENSRQRAVGGQVEVHLDSGN